MTVFAALLVSGCMGDNDPATGTAASLQQGESAPREEPLEGTIVCMGDSLTEGLGVQESSAYPARLEGLLRQAGFRWRVVNAGISGETSSGALSRTDWVMTLDPDIVILETGANDGLRGIDPGLMEKNIDAIVGKFRGRGVTVVLAGMKMLLNLGPEYTREFEAVYTRVAGRHGLVFIPFFLEGVAADPALNQEDGIHPNADGYRVVAETVLPYVEKAILRRTGDAGR
jgi:acyl-CoA thioesterase-1